MRKIKFIPTLFAFLFFVISIQTIAQPKEAMNKTDANGKKQGHWEKHYPSGKIQYKGEFKNDKPIGLFTRYYEDGSVQAKINYDSDGVERAKIFYPRTGNLMAQGNYIDQKKDSIWLFYSEDGVLTNSETYKNNRKNGMSIIYYSNGSISEKVNYINDQKSGKWEQFYENGNPKLSATVEDGIKYMGEFISYYPNGNKQQSGKYVDGMKHSSWYFFNEDGSIETIHVFRYGKFVEEHPQNGLFDEYYPNDIKRHEYTYKNGKKNGPFREYYNQGEWVTEEATDEFGYSYPVQRLKGIQIMREGRYKDDQLDGEIKYYDENGKLTKKEFYQNGNLIK